MFNIAQIKKQAARMEQQMKEIQAQLAVRTVEATSNCAIHSPFRISISIRTCFPKLPLVL